MLKPIGCGLLLCALLWAGSAPVCAQSREGTGTVTGHVICADTQNPARFAGVMLYSVPTSVAATAPNLDAGANASQMQAFQKALQQEMSAVSYVQTQTGIDGSFTAEDVPPGDYYVLASVAGYIQPRNLLQAAYDAGEDITKAVSGVSIIRVAADRTASIDVTVNRGAAVEGHVLWDDGGPVNGAMVMAEPTSKEHKNLPPQFAMMAVGSGLNGLMGLTDDRGRYRISGLIPGEYTVKAVLQTRTQMSMQQGRMNLNGLMAASPLQVYAPSAFHKPAAKPVTLSAGEERTDEDITFNLEGTHTVSGRITSAEDHHALSEARVMLKDASDKEFARSSGLDSDGTFHVTFVPPGTYTLEVSDGADTVPTEPTKGGLLNFTQNKTVRSYEDAKQSVVVLDDDVTGQNIELTPSKNVKPGISIGGLVGGIVGAEAPPPPASSSH